VVGPSGSIGNLRSRDNLSGAIVESPARIRRVFTLIEQSVEIRSLEFHNGTAGNQTPERCKHRRDVGLDVNHAKIEVARCLHHFVRKAGQMPNELPSVHAVQLTPDSFERPTALDHQELMLPVEVKELWV
jgi:hypothetical protein